jgi:predicted ATPase with chaperone activity
MTRMSKAPLLGASLLALSLMLAGPLSPATAQEQEQQQDVPQATTTEIAPDQLDAFVNAALDVQRVQQDLSAELQAAESEEEANRLQQEAQDEAVQAVEGHGLTVDQYDSILRAATADPDLYATIIALMQERQQ